MAKSWDIQPSGPRPVPRKAPAQRPLRAQRLRPAPTRTSAVPLKRRRQLKRRRLLVIGLVLFLLFFILIEVVLWQPWFRVATIEATGPGAEVLPVFVEESLHGTRYFLVPKNSIFFLPETELRSAILEKYPDLSAVSLSAKGLTTLSVATVGRASIFWWCGTSYTTPSENCYDTDGDGLVFAYVASDLSMASSSTATGMLRVYAPLASSSAMVTGPLGSHLASPAHVPGVTQFVKAMRSLGADVVAVDMRDDEADLYTEAGTRITYLIGKEAAAAALAASAFPTLNLNDGSLSYVDLRFSGKVFFKKIGEVQ